MIGSENVAPNTAKIIPCRDYEAQERALAEGLVGYKFAMWEKTQHAIKWARLMRA